MFSSPAYIKRSTSAVEVLVIVSVSLGLSMVNAAVSCPNIYCMLCETFNNFASSCRSFLSVNYVECYCILSYGFLKNEGDVCSS